MKANRSIPRIQRCRLCRGWGHVVREGEPLPWHPSFGLSTCLRCHGTGRGRFMPQFEASDVIREAVAASAREYPA